MIGVIQGLSIKTKLSMAFAGFMGRNIGYLVSYCTFLIKMSQQPRKICTHSRG